MECIECKDSYSNKKSGLCYVCENKSIGKINGWLYFPALGLILNFIYSILGFYVFLKITFSILNKKELFSYYFIGEVSLMMLFLIISFYATMLFFRHKKGTRKAMIIYYVTGLIIALHSTIFAAIIYDVPLDVNDAKTLLSRIVGIVVWVPYFILSKRINVVFCR